jgi:Cysteine rich repeat
MMLESVTRLPVRPRIGPDCSPRARRLARAAARLALSAVIGACAIQSALADEHHPNAAQGPIRQACSVEIQTYCSDVTPGEGRLRACLSAHRDELTTDCRNALDSGNSRGD